jgi:ketosteroid isomerase-like protein
VSASDEVLSAANALVDAFGAHDKDRYFSCFAEDATLLFYTTPRLLPSLSAFKDEFATWEKEYGYHVLKCVSSEQNVQILGDDVGVFTHSVLTNVMMNDGEAEQRERETIVFRREPDGRWLAVHEHLSPAP